MVVSRPLAVPPLELPRIRRTILRTDSRLLNLGQPTSAVGWHHPQMEHKPFRLLPDEEFAKLSREEKIAYLSMAIEAVKQNAPVTGLIHAPSDEPDNGLNVRDAATMRGMVYTASRCSCAESGRVPAMVLIARLAEESPATDPSRTGRSLSTTRKKTKNYRCAQNVVPTLPPS